MTSHDVVSRARRLLRTKKIGHTGTLDPLATGVLVLCVGKATRLADYIQAGEKRYLCRMLLGKGTDTLDTEGVVTSEAPAGHIGPEHLAAALPCFLGEQLQTPPSVSAIKKDGVPLYRLARQGEMVVPEPRRVRVESLELQDFCADPVHPSALLTVECSKGTYVRALVRDIGRRLGVPACVCSLHRSRNAGFEDSEAIPLAELEEMTPEEIAGAMLPMDTVCRFLPSFSTGDARRLSCGLPVSARVPDTDAIVALAGGEVAALGRVEEGMFYPGKVFIDP